MVLTCVLAACGGAPQTPPATAPSVNPEASGDAVLRIGDSWVRASVVQGSSLPASVAARYAVDRDPHALLLLVVGGKGPPETAAPLPVQVTARVTDLSGGVQDIAMRQVRDGDAIDAIGTLHTGLPDTLRFELRIVMDGQSRTLAFQREFYP